MSSFPDTHTHTHSRRSSCCYCNEGREQTGLVLESQSFYEGKSWERVQWREGREEEEEEIEEKKAKASR